MAINNRDRSTVGNTDTAHNMGTLDRQARSTHTQAADSNSHMQEDSKRRETRSGGMHVAASPPPRSSQTVALPRLFLALVGELH